MYRRRDVIARQQEKWKRCGLTKGQQPHFSPGKKKQTNSPFVQQDEGGCGDHEGGSLGGPGGGLGTPQAGLSQPKWTPKGHRGGGGGAGRKCVNGRSKANGADLYVARMTRSGLLGNAMPCWRCLEWCRWAGVKRVFHYAVDVDGLEDEDVGGKRKERGKGGRWVCVKVNEVQPENCYWTHGDGRILGGG